VGFPWDDGSGLAAAAHSPVSPRRHRLLVLDAAGRTATTDRGSTRGGRGRLAEQRAQDEALQAYLDQRSSLLLEKDLRKSEEGSEVRTLAQARTATVIQRLDADGNRNVIRFLDEAGLTKVGQPSIRLLAGVDLQGARLGNIDLIVST
jgi:hypothetical protein